MRRTRQPRRTIVRAIALLAGAALTITACDTGEEEPADAEQSFRSGQVVRVILGSTPGGGFDTHTRLLQPYLDAAIEDASGVNVRVVVENMPGADHRIATENVFNAEPDGSRILFSSLALMATNEVIRGAETTLTEMTGLASAGRSVRGTVVRTDVDWPGNTLADVLEYSTTNDMLISHPGLDVDLALLRLLLDDAGVEVGWKPVTIGQTAEDVAALLRGEIEAAYADLGGMKEALDDNPDQLRAVAQHGCERAEEVPDVPTIVEQGLPNAEEICKTIISGHPLVFLGPPGLPEAITTDLREALQAALTNEEYLEKVLQARQPHDWISGEEVETLVTDTIGLFEEYKDQLFDE